MAIPQMQMTMDEIKNLANTITKTDASLAQVMSNLAKQTQMVAETKTSFNATLAKVASRTLGDYKAQKKQFDELNKKSDDFRKSQFDVLKKINDLQKAGATANADKIKEQKDILDTLHDNHQKMIMLETRAYEKIAKENLKIIKDFEDGIENISDSLDKALTGKSVFKKISYIGEEFKDTIEGAMQGGFSGMEKLLKSSLGGITTVFEMRALKLAKQGEKDLARMEELIARGAKSGGITEDDKELTALEVSKTSTEKDATGMLEISKGMKMLSIGVMGVVSAFKMLIDAEAKVKEFNKDMLDDAGGSLSFLKHSQEGLAESLNIYREGFANMANTVGMKADEIKAQFIALQDTNLFNKEKLKDFAGFQRAFSTLATYSKGLGISITETTELAESFASSMAIDTSTTDGMETLSSAFQSIGFYASKSNISTKAFTNQLKEVNEKSTTFNKSLTQTASMMIKFNKTLGASRAKEFFEGFEDMKEKEFGDFIKSTAMAGGPASQAIQKVIQQNALESASQLKKTFTSKEEKEAFAKASKEAGLNIDLNAPVEKLVAQLQGVDLSSDAFIKFSSTLEDSGLGNVPALLEKLKATTISAKGVGAGKGYEEVASAQRELSIGGQYAMKFAGIQGLVESITKKKGSTISEIKDEKDREYLRLVLKQQGMSAKEIETLITLDERARGDFMKAQAIQAKYAGATAEEKKKMDEQLSKLGMKMGEQGKLVTKNTNQMIEGVSDIYLATAETVSEEEKAKEPKVKSEQELMKDQVDATWGIGDRLEATFGVYLEQLNSYVARILSYISSWFGSQSDEEMKTQQRIQEEKIEEKEKYERQIREEKQKLDEFKKAGNKEEVAKSQERIKELSRLTEGKQSELELLQKGVTLIGTKTQQELQLATTKADTAKKAFGEGTTGAKLGALKENLGKSTNQEILNLLDEMRDIYEAVEEGDATDEQKKKLADFQQKVKASGLQLQMDSSLGTEYAKIFDAQGRELFASVEGYISDTNEANTDVLHKELLSSKNKQKELGSFFKDIGAKNQEEAKKILEEYRSDILEQENDLYFNTLTKEQEDKKKMLEGAMKKYSITADFQSGITDSYLGLSKDGEKFFQTTDAMSLDSETMKEAFNPALFAKAQTEENKRNEQNTINVISEGIVQGELKKTTPTLPLPMNDFIWREKGGLQSFSPQDNVIGFKDQGKMGSAINSMMAGNTTNNNNNARAMFNININGGNKDEVLKVITDALKRAGVVTERTSYA